MLFNLSPRALDNCTNYANIDFYDDINTTRVFRHHENLTLVEMLKQMEFNDFIIFTASKNLESILKCIVQPLVRFLLIVDEDLPSFKHLTAILNRTWIDNGAFKIFISSQDGIYTFDPFYRNNNDGSYGKLNWFPVPIERKLKQLNGYPLRVELFSSTYTLARTKQPKNSDDFDGPDIDVARLTAAVLNATILLVKNDGSKFGFRTPNGSFTGALKTIQKRTSDIAFVTFFIKDYETRSIEFSASVYSDDLCLIVKKAEKIPQFILPLVTFEENLWITLLIFCFIGTIFWCILRFINNRIYSTFILKRIKFNLPTHTKRLSTALQYIQIFVDTIILFLNAPLRRFPRVQSERLFAGSICLLSLNIVSMFQSNLATCYVKPLYYRNVQTLEEFAETKKNILVKYPAMMTDIFPEDSSDLFRTLYKRMVLVPNASLTAIEVTNKMNMAGVARKTTLKIQKEEAEVHLIPECPRNYHLSYVYTKHWILAEYIDSIILDLKQAGIINKWIEDVNFRIKLEKSKNTEFTVHHRVLRIDDFALAFMILASGCFFAFVLFLIENCLMKDSFKNFKYLP
ncbi:hypothetical protein PVAND_010779 [Polypedilum vanderplanki]|uniref:Ionotropic glutamate receptor C-terminal domain-containing protein n=1 Tax=Polypedilum vanderplanki TaxID=319348 RepID=A0A9J6CID3_POLVA|nr:hypothetical protein PVAND_010779 [Polypedilum vanderplanki]